MDMVQAKEKYYTELNGEENLCLDERLPNIATHFIIALDERGDRIL